MSVFKKGFLSVDKKHLSEGARIDNELTYENFQAQDQY
jgi:hypothetical protein